MKQNQTKQTDKAKELLTGGYYEKFKSKQGRERDAGRTVTPVTKDTFILL